MAEGTAKPEASLSLCLTCAGCRLAPPQELLDDDDVVRCARPVALWRAAADAAGVPRSGTNAVARSVPAKKGDVRSLAELLVESMRLSRRAAARKVAHMRPQGWTRDVSSSITMRVPIIGEWLEKEGAAATSPTLQPTAAVPAVQAVQVVLESGSWMGVDADGSDSRLARPGIRVRVRRHGDASDGLL